MVKEAGTAFAVLAIYILTLLLPLHQAAGLQRDLDALGFATLDSWSVCTALVQDDAGNPRSEAAVNCPALGVAKHQLGAVPPPAPLPTPPSRVAPVVYAALATRAGPPLPGHIAQARAPPASV